MSFLYYIILPAMYNNNSITRISSSTITHISIMLAGTSTALESRILCCNKLLSPLCVSSTTTTTTLGVISKTNIKNGKTNSNYIGSNSFTTATYKKSNQNNQFSKSYLNKHQTNQYIKENIHGRRYFRATTPTFEEKRDLYEVLGVPRTATKQEIKQAFYGLAKKYHPDTNRDDPNAHKKFAEISNAYDVLFDENKRATYDRAGHQGATAENMEHGGFPGGFHPGGQGQEFDLEDLFGDLGDLFGGGQGFGKSRSSNGADIQVNLHIDFMEAVNGCEKEIQFYGNSSCNTCDGSGAKPGTKPQTCKSCGGTGTTIKSNGLFQMASTCKACKGSGKVIKDHCGTCKGKGTTYGQRTISIKVPQGINNGVNIKLTGQGEPGTGRGSRRGNLFVNVTISEHELFRRQGNDVHVDVPITISQAILGATVVVPTLTGEVDLKVPAGTQPGEKRVLKGKGIRAVNSPEYGNQYVHFIVSIPKNISSKQEDLIKEFEQEDKNNCGPLDSLTHPVLSFWNKSMKRWRDYVSKNFKNNN